MASVQKKNFLIYCLINPFLKEGGEGKMASGKKE